MIEAALQKAMLAPQVRLHGDVDGAMLGAVLAAESSEGDGPIVVELMTSGGDADYARRIALEIGRLRARSGRRVVFLGSTIVYSAGVVIMSAFPIEDRFLTPDAVLMIHERHLTRTIELDGALGACEQALLERLEEVRAGIELERQGFRDLVRGSEISYDKIVSQARNAWYVPAGEARRIKLVADLFDPSLA